MPSLSAAMQTAAAASAAAASAQFSYNPTTTRTPMMQGQGPLSAYSQITCQVRPPLIFASVKGGFIAEQFYGVGLGYR